MKQQQPISFYLDQKKKPRNGVMAHLLRASGGHNNKPRVPEFVKRPPADDAGPRKGKLSVDVSGTRR